jgi:hypothetical protein
MVRWWTAISGAIPRRQSLVSNDPSEVQQHRKSTLEKFLNKGEKRPRALRKLLICLGKVANLRRTRVRANALQLLQGL